MAKKLNILKGGITLGAEHKNALQTSYIQQNNCEI